MDGNAALQAVILFTQMGDGALGPAGLGRLKRNQKANA